MLTDFELLDRIIAGDEAALGALIDRYRPIGLAVATGKLRNPEDAEDVVQKAFVSVWKNAAKFKRQASFKTWFIRIVVNLSYNLYDWKKRRQFLKHDSFDQPIGETELVLGDTLASDESVHRKIEHDEHSIRVHRALAAMPAKEREILTLIGIHQVPYSEIATRLGLNIGTVKSRIARARDLLRSTLDTLGPERQEPAMAGTAERTDQHRIKGPRPQHPRGGKLEHSKALLRAGFTSRGIRRLLGIHATTLSRTRRELVKAEGEILCKCGQPTSHRGWCAVRFAASDARKAFLARWHSKSRGVSGYGNGSRRSRVTPAIMSHPAARNCSESSQLISA